MSSSDSPTMHRSISMPAQPQPLQTKPMKRSQEKETLVEEDYYPESPNCERRMKSLCGNRDRLGSFTQSSNNFATTEWAGSTIELHSDPRRNEIDALCYRRKPHRVIEKNGRENVTFKKIPEKSWRYMRDFVTTLVRWILPRKFLTYTTSITVNSTPTQLKADDSKLTSDWKSSEDIIQINDKNKHCDVEINEVEISKKPRVTFSLYD